MDSGAAPGTYHLTGSGEPCTWAEVARWVFEGLGADPERVRPVGTAEYTAGKAGIAPRPTNSCLDTTSLEATGFSPRDSRAVVRSVLSTTHD